MSRWHRFNHVCMRYREFLKLGGAVVVLLSWIIDYSIVQRSKSSEQLHEQLSSTYLQLKIDLSLADGSALSAERNSAMLSQLQVLFNHTARILASIELMDESSPTYNPSMAQNLTDHVLPELNRQSARLLAIHEGELLLLRSDLLMSSMVRVRLAGSASDSAAFERMYGDSIRLGNHLQILRGLRDGRQDLLIRSTFQPRPDQAPVPGWTIEPFPGPNGLADLQAFVDTQGSTLRALLNEWSSWLGSETWSADAARGRSRGWVSVWKPCFVLLFCLGSIAALLGGWQDARASVAGAPAVALRDPVTEKVQSSDSDGTMHDPS